MTKQSILRYYCCACSLTLRRNCAGNSRILKMVTIYITVISSSPYAKSPDPGAVAAGPLEHLLCLPLQPLCLAPGQGDRTGELGWAGLGCQAGAVPSQGSHALPMDHTGLQPCRACLKCGNGTKATLGIICCPFLTHVVFL